MGRRGARQDGRAAPREITLGALVLVALGLWIFGGDWINATTVALVVISLMLVLKVVSWDDIVKNAPAWNTLAWFATLVALADGLSRVGFVKWFADAVGVHMTRRLLAVHRDDPVLVLVFYFTHYLFASITAHVTALLPVMLAVGASIPGIDMPQFALLLCLTLGIMGVLTPFATGPSPVYYGSGDLPTKDYWRLGRGLRRAVHRDPAHRRGAVAGADPLSATLARQPARFARAGCHRTGAGPTR